MAKRGTAFCIFAVGLAAGLAGCDLYWGNNNNGDDVCAGGSIESDSSYRNPQTGTCEDFGTGGDCGGCVPCYETAPSNINASWPVCDSSCDGLTEASCLSTTGCHAAYLDVTSAGTAYWGCFGIAPLTPTTTAACETLDAQDCISRDDCTSTYDSDSNPGDPSFASCAPEPGGGPCDCSPGNHCAELCPGGGDLISSTQACYETCVPDMTCADIACPANEVCVLACDNNAGDCTPTCAPSGIDPGQCTGDVTCNTAPPACPTGTFAGIASGCYTGYCIPAAACGPGDPGACTGEVTCNGAPPSCPAGTTAGIANGCYSGYCIPDGACPAPPACESLATEAACLARTDCLAQYTGNNCTCDSAGSCTCASTTFEMCMMDGYL
jgi:hypothetical protein